MKIPLLIPCLLCIVLTFSQGTLTSHIEWDGTSVSAAAYKEAEYFLSTIDSNVLKSFFDDGFSLVITDRDINGFLFNNRFHGRVVGAFSPSKGRIYISYGGYRFIPHEFGHYVNYKSGRQSDSPEFNQIMLCEIDAAIASGLVSSRQAEIASEYFAEMYMYLCLDYRSARSSCPKTCEFIKECASSL